MTAIIMFHEPSGTPATLRPQSKIWGVASRDTPGLAHLVKENAVV